METVFFYGLFMDRELLEDKGFSPRNMRYASLDDYELTIAKRATLSAKPGACCYGTVMDLERKELDRLYGSDGVEDYVPEPVEPKTTDGEPVKALAYILPLEKVSGSNSEYAKKLAEVAMKLELPGDYVEEIRAWV